MSRSRTRASAFREASRAGSSSASSARPPRPSRRSPAPASARDLACDRGGARGHDRRRSRRRRRNDFRVEIPLESGGDRRLTRIVALDVGSSSVRAIAYDEAGVAEPGDAHLAYAELRRRPPRRRLPGGARAGRRRRRARDLVLLALARRRRRARPAAHAGAHVARSSPASLPRARPRGLPPANRLLPPSGVLAREDRPPRRDGVEAARYLSFGDYLLLRLAGEARTSVSTASGTGLFDPNALAWDEETLDALGLDAGAARAASRTTRSPACGRRSATARARTSARAASSRGRAAVMVGTSAAARVVYERRRSRRRPASFSTASTPRASAKAARSPTAATCTRGCAARCTTSTPRRSPTVPPPATG